MEKKRSKCWICNKRRLCMRVEVLEQCGDIAGHKEWICCECENEMMEC